MFTYGYISELSLLTADKYCLGALIGIAHTLNPSNKKRFGDYLKKLLPWGTNLFFFFIKLISQITREREKEGRGDDVCRARNNVRCTSNEKFKSIETELSEISKYFLRNSRDDEINNDSSKSFLNRMKLDRNTGMKSNVKHFLELIYETQISKITPEIRNSEECRTVRSPVLTGALTAGNMEVLSIMPTPKYLLKNSSLQYTAREIGIWRALRLLSLNRINTANWNENTFISDDIIDELEVVKEIKNLPGSGILSLGSGISGPGSKVKVDICDFYNPFQILGMNNVRMESEEVLGILSDVDEIYGVKKGKEEARGVEMGGEDGMLRDEKGGNDENRRDNNDGGGNEYGIKNGAVDSIKVLEEVKQKKTVNERIHLAKNLFMNTSALIIGSGRDNHTKNNGNQNNYNNNYNSAYNNDNNNNYGSTDTNNSQNEDIDFKFIVERILADFRIHWRGLLLSGKNCKIKNNQKIGGINKISENDGMKNYENNAKQKNYFENLDNTSTKLTVTHNSLNNIISILHAGIIEFDNPYGGWRTGTSGSGITLETRILGKLELVKSLMRELSFSWNSQVQDPSHLTSRYILLFQGNVL